MSSFLTFAVLLIGAGSDEIGLNFQAQLGYEPAVLLRGKDFRKHVSDLTLDVLSIVLYSSHSLRLKIGVQTRGGLGIGAIGSLGSSIISGPIETSLNLYPDSIWLGGGVLSMVTLESSVGGEIGYSFDSPFRFWRKEGSIYLGLEKVWGRFYSKESWVKSDSVKETEQFNVTSKASGLQGHIGLGMPLCTFGRFRLQMHFMLKGGAVKEQSIELLDAPPGTVWQGPRTLPRWGIALGLTLNYNGGKQK